jgi:UDP-glucuronate 4-epimerase
MKVLVTGAAGFIGYHVARRLAETKRCEVLGIDNLSDYYDPALKRARIQQLVAIGSDHFRFLQADFADAPKFAGLVAHFQPDYVVHLGAQPGVRFSMEQPAAYTRSNLEGFASVLEACRRAPPRHLVFASSSSVYGAGAKSPFRESDNTDQPISYYGATKKANELMAFSYAHNHGINVTGLRFFTVYGPWGRPDMAMNLFTEAIFNGKPIKVFNGGNMSRDFTYVDDIVECINRVLIKVPSNEQIPMNLFNIGNNSPEKLGDFIDATEASLGKIAQKVFLPMQAGDVEKTYADVQSLIDYIDYKPQVSIHEGIGKFVSWYKDSRELV